MTRLHLLVALFCVTFIAARPKNDVDSNRGYLDPIEMARILKRNCRCQPRDHLVYISNQFSKVRLLPANTYISCTLSFVLTEDEYPEFDAGNFYIPHGVLLRRCSSVTSYCSPGIECTSVANETITQKVAVKVQPVSSYIFVNLTQDTACQCLSSAKKKMLRWTFLG